MKFLLFIPCTLLAIAVFGQRKQNILTEKIPKLSIYNINGDTTNLKSISKGKVTLIDFWFIPCAPCFAEMNLLHKVYAKYRGNPNFNFLAITLTDSAFVRPLVENRNTSTNETYSYFNSMAKMDTFRLPVYFIKNVTSTQKTWKKVKMGFTGEGDGPLKERPNYPNKIFGFLGYPTILIYNKEGKLIYNKTGFEKGNEEIQLKRLQEIIDVAL